MTNSRKDPSHPHEAPAEDRPIREGTVLPELPWHDFPVHRRLGVLWQLTGGTSESLTAQRSCRVGTWVRRYPPSDATAVLGSDGRFHLWRNDHGTLCEGRQHRQHTHWATNGTDYRVQKSAVDGQVWRYEATDVEWLVEAEGPGISPSSIEPSERCPLLAEYWPRPVNTTAIGRIRARLIDVLGHGCSCCRGALACAVDHDPFSGLVRGYLCRDCNARVDRCRHLAECRFAEYLNEPPALPMALLYPRKPTPRQTHRMEKLHELVSHHPECGVELWTLRDER